MLNQTRKFYSKILGKQRPSKNDVEQIIQMGEAFKELIKSPAWRSIEGFMERQREGTRDYMDYDLGNVNAMSVAKFFGAFLKYFLFIGENRAYKKLEKFIDVTIENGNRYAAQQAKDAEKQS